MAHAAINYCLKSEVSTVNYVQPVTEHYESLKNCSKSTSAIKVATCTMKNTDDFCHQGRPSCATAKSTPFSVSKDDWDTKEDTGSSMKNALYVHVVCQRNVFG